MKKRAIKILCLASLISLMLPALASCMKNGGDEIFFLGATGPLSGDSASYGVSVNKGARLAVEHVNAKGERRFKFEMKDDHADPREATVNYALLADAGMHVSLGGVTSGAGEAFAKQANAEGLFCMTPSGSADNVIKDMKYSFRLCFGDSDQGVLAAREIKERGYKSVGAMYDTSDTYSSGIYEAFKAEMARLGIKYNEQKFDAENRTDFSTQAAALSDCDVIFMPFYYNEAQLFIKAAARRGSDAVFFGCDGFDGIAGYVDEIDKRIMYITPFDVNSDDADTRAFVEAYEARYGAKPDQFAADAYDTVMVIAAAIEQAGVSDYSISPSELGDIIVDTITAPGFSFSGLTGRMSWDVSGACTKEPRIVEI